MFPLSFVRVGTGMVVLSLVLGLVEWMLGRLGVDPTGSSLGSTIVLVGLVSLWPWLGPRAMVWMLNPKRVVNDESMQSRLEEALAMVRGERVAGVRLVVFSDAGERAVTLGTRERSLIAVSTGAVRNLDDTKLQALLAHELGHLVAGHSAQSYGFLSALFMAKMLFGGFGVPIAMFLLVVFLYLLRSNEYEADRIGSEMVGRASMRSLLKALKASSAGGKWTESAWAEALSTHPRFSQRLARLSEAD